MAGIRRAKATQAERLVSQVIWHSFLAFRRERSYLSADTNALREAPIWRGYQRYPKALYEFV
jgi:hypothetical protein